MRTITKKEFESIIKKHKMWLKDKSKGECANLHDTDMTKINLKNINLSQANLEGANFEKIIFNNVNLSQANLRHANLSNTNLTFINLSNANLDGANLNSANLNNANLSNASLNFANLSRAKLFCANLNSTCFFNANMTWADFKSANMSCSDLGYTNLRYVDFRNTNLRYANLYGANLSNMQIDASTDGITIECPEEGSFIGYKKAQDKIVVLEILADAKRSSATSHKCRCSKAKVLRIEEFDGTISKVKSISSDFDEYFIYKIGKTVEVPDFDENRWNECSTGIHFFMNKEMAKQYNLNN